MPLSNLKYEATIESLFFGMDFKKQVEKLVQKHWMRIRAYF